MWHQRLADGVDALDPGACATAAELIRQLPEDVATLAAGLPVEATGVTVRNVGAHLVVSDTLREVRVTWAGRFLVWDRGYVVGEEHSTVAAIRKAARHLAGQIDVSSSS